MKAILEFNLPEESADLNLALKGHEWARALHKFSESIRIRIKYADETMTDETYAELEGLQKELAEILEDYNLSFFTIP